MSPEKHRSDNEVTHGKPKEDTRDALVQTPAHVNASPRSIPSDTKQTHDAPPSGETVASPGAQAHSPEEESELFSTDYVDKLVASFWTKVDQKIEQAVSHYQASPQAGQQSNTQDNAQTQDAKKEDKNDGNKSFSGCLFASVQKTRPRAKGFNLKRWICMKMNVQIKLVFI